MAKCASETVETVEEEVTRYIRASFSFDSSDTLADMWSKIADDFPRIAKAARPYIIAQASSIASEQFFGCAVRIDTRFRATMLPRLLNLLLFAQANIFRREHHENNGQLAWMCDVPDVE